MCSIRSTIEETVTEFEEPKKEIILTAEEIMQKNRVTIGELITLARNKTAKDELYTCEATIARIYDKKWSYTACPYCTRKMESNATECQNCKAFVKMPVEKYRYAMRVDDDNDNTTFVAEAEYFLKDPVQKLMELRMLDDGEKLIKERLLKPLNEKHLFQIKFDKFSYQDGPGRSFTITHTFVEPKVEENAQEREDEAEEISADTPPKSPPTKKMRKN
ncbi:hypothetical protein FRX31_012725 [Thalictrum thalictroides]|uniref:Replication factor A C-terminal domain-containing protein n=1 Tax=Thalictrum thalictroides TaxID=46969 RepID=A0A7J6WL45_THATH|nr:hypothetical protein FRX31_012725 [Thalictrum thalictroides]